MTERMLPDSQAAHQRRTVEELLGPTLVRARWSIFWERLWPALASIATALGLFLALSWGGLWLWLPPLGRAIGVVALIVLTIVAMLPLIFVRMPTFVERLRRVDRASQIPHRPATAIADELMATPADPVSMALWRAHVERAKAAAHKLKAGMPTPRVAARDPFALRALVLIAVIVTFFAAGNDRGRRILAAFDWQGVVTTLNYRVDAWVTPPPYTGRPPVILPGVRSGEPVRAAAPVAVPTGSTLVIRATGRSNLEVAVSGGLTTAANATPTPTPAGTEEHRFTVTDGGTATLRGLSDTITWTFTAIPDRPPTIALTKEPEPQLRGSLMLAYKIEDDYGATEAHATFKIKPAATPAIAGSKPSRPLYGAPDFNLTLPQSRTKNGAGQTIKDVSEHPWAGVDVTLELLARDEAGNEGRSTATEMRLPERMFTKPVARALIEQRRVLALDANAKPRVLTAIDALTIAPERFTPQASIYLGLRSIFWNLTHARTDDQLREVVARMWSMAVTIEDGNMSDAEAALRAAQDALRQALERGATDEEIKKLMEQLRAALDRFLQALAEELRKNPQAARPLDRNSRQLRSQDLKSMLDRMERMARSGAKDAARQLLDQLQQMLENLQMARPGGEMDSDDDMMSALDELGDMIRKQQQLRDRTFREGQEQRRQRGSRGQPQPGDKSLGELKEGQGELKEQLKKLLEELKKRGLAQPGQPGQGELDQLGRAGEAMGEAEGSLGEGNPDSAVDAQGRALEALRKGAQGLAQALQQQMGTGPGPGQPGRMGPSRAQQDTDPLGRPLRGRDYGDDTTVKVPGEIDVQRARRILEELRRRFGESFRPQLELDYIERLLKDF